MLDSYRQKGKQALSKLTSTGFFSIFLTNILIKCIGLVGGMILTRLMSKSDYGLYTYVLNAYGMLNLIADFGTGIASIQLCSESHAEPERQRAYFIYSLRWGVGFSALAGLTVLLSPLFYPFQFAESVPLTVMLCLLPLLQNLNRFLLNNAQIHLQNRVYARINLFTSLIHYLVLLPMAHLYSFTGALLSEYVICSCTIVFGVVQSRKFLFLTASTKILSRKERRDFLRLSSSSGLNNIVSNALVLVDVFLLGLILRQEDILASYKVAATIPTALAFIPSAAHTYLAPLLARNNNRPDVVRGMYLKALAGISAFNLLVCAGMIVLGPSLLGLLYGAQYEDAYVCFSILLVGYFFSAVRSVTYITIYTQRRIRVILCITIASNLCNILLDVALIPLLGSPGAALASTLVNLAIAVIMVVYVLRHLRARLASEPT